MFSGFLTNDVAKPANQTKKYIKQLKHTSKYNIPKKKN